MKLQVLVVKLRKILTNQYIGKDSSLNGVVGISGATMTSNAYKAAIADAFTAFDMINGGAL